MKNRKSRSSRQLWSSNLLVKRVWRIEWLSEMQSQVDEWIESRALTIVILHFTNDNESCNKSRRREESWKQRVIVLKTRSYLLPLLLHDNSKFSQVDPIPSQGFEAVRRKVNWNNDSFSRLLFKFSRFYIFILPFLDFLKFWINISTRKISLDDYLFSLRRIVAHNQIYWYFINLILLLDLILILLLLLFLF